jgi:hypothetical protein
MAEHFGSGRKPLFLQQESDAESKPQQDAGQAALRKIQPKGLPALWLSSEPVESVVAPQIPGVSDAPATQAKPLSWIQQESSDQPAPAPRRVSLASSTRQSSASEISDSSSDSSSDSDGETAPDTNAATSLFNLRNSKGQLVGRHTSGASQGLITLSSEIY